MFAARYLFDESEWPLVRVDAPATAPDEQEFRTLLAWYTSVLERGRPFVLLFELGRGAPMSGERRDALRRHAREHRAALVANQRGLGIVAPSAFHRATARALLWLIQPPYAVEIFATWDAARSWAHSRIPSIALAGHGATPKVDRVSQALH